MLSEQGTGTRESSSSGTRIDSGRLLDRIEARVRSFPDEFAIRFVEDNAGHHTVLSWKELWQLAANAQRVFESHRLKAGDRLILMLPTSPEFVASLLGAFNAGLVPTTLAPANRFHETAALRDEWKQIAGAFAPKAIISNDALDFPGADVIDIAELSSAANDGDASRSAPQEIAYIQFSSGSTGRPKGVALGWPAIHANIKGMASRLSLDPASQVCSWLPMYHDMGLFGMLLTSLYYGCPITVMDSGLFIANPKVWLRALAEYRTQITVAPPSALHYALELLRRRPVKGLDLSALEIMFCGAEPIPPRLVREFSELMREYGIGPRALTPVYGLAEATLAVTIPVPDRMPSLDRIDRSAMEIAGEAQPPADDGTRIVEVVGVGIPLENIEVRIVDEWERPLDERAIGRILVKSPSLMSGTVDAGRLQPCTTEWLDTGDLGYFAEGELYVTGRLKDIIIKGGRNYAPERIEEIAAMADGINRAVAFGVFDAERMTEQVIVMAEAAPKLLKEAEGRDGLRLAVRKMLHSADYPVDEVVLVPRGDLPRTTSGKIRRHECRTIYQDNKSR